MLLYLLSAEEKSLDLKEHWYFRYEDLCLYSDFSGIGNLSGLLFISRIWHNLNEISYLATFTEESFYFLIF